MRYDRALTQTSNAQFRAAILLQEKTQINSRQMVQLDGGWPESVKEQSLLLLVWRHYITRQYTKDVS